jgi:hypothetical protein
MRNLAQRIIHIIQQPELDKSFSRDANHQIEKDTTTA